LRSLSTLDRLSCLQACPSDNRSTAISLADHTIIRSSQEWNEFYRNCLEGLGRGVDGAICKRLDAPYSIAALKVKPIETVDVVVIGAYRDAQGYDASAVLSLLLVVPYGGGQRWATVGMLNRQHVPRADWTYLWARCQPYIQLTRPAGLDWILYRNLPDTWLGPRLVIEVEGRLLLGLSRRYTLGGNGAPKYQLEAIKFKRVRDDKGPELATTAERTLQTFRLPTNPQLPETQQYLL
jgi:ATP-dependent DNA ligase